MSTAPVFITRDHYTGRYTASVKAFAHSTPRWVRAGSIAAQAPTGVLWESFGTPRGFKNEQVGRERYVADRDGNLMIFNSEGGITLVHPAERKIRILTKEV